MTPHPSLRATFPSVWGRLYMGIYRSPLRGGPVKQSKTDEGPIGSPLLQFCGVRCPHRALGVIEGFAPYTKTGWEGGILIFMSPTYIHTPTRY